MSHILLVGNLRSSLTLARQLARDGHTLYCGVEQEDPYLHKSKAIAGWLLHAPIDACPELALTQIERYLRANPQIATVVPVSDMATRLFTQYPDRFPWVRVAVANADAVKKAIDKLGMFELCERIGVRVAPYNIVTSLQGLHEATAAIGYPCVVKPVDPTHFVASCKALILREPGQLSAHLRAWPIEHRQLFVQAYVPGLRHDVMFAATEGRLVGAVDAVIVRNDNADGTGYATEMVSAQPTLRMIREVTAVVGALAYSGVGAVQFMVDPVTGHSTFLEVNPRLSACYKVAEVSGLPLSRLILRSGGVSRLSRDDDPWDFQVGQRVAWIKGDIGGLRRELKAGTLTPAAALGWVGATLRAATYRHHLTFDPMDLTPSFWIYLHPFLGGLQRLRGLISARGSEQRAPRRAAA